MPDVRYSNLVVIAFPLTGLEIWLKSEASADLFRLVEILNESGRFV